MRVRFLQLKATQMCIHWLHSVAMKDVGLRIRVQRELREQFLEACKAQDKPAAQVLREFMREYVAECGVRSEQVERRTTRPHKADVG